LNAKEAIMTSSQLPPRPDFEAIAAAAPSSADRRTFTLALIGNLVSSWSNNESLFIYVLMILLRTDQASAALTFATLNTTRARLDLIQRLAKISIRDKELDKALSKIIDRFDDSTHVRNEFNQCMYIVDDAGQITHTQSMRIVQTKNSVQFGEKKSMDDARLKSMIKATRDMTRINRDIWDFLPRLERHLRSPDIATDSAATKATPPNLASLG
jgi:transcriptional regulator with PAS, ATPase and Fis domain